MIRRYNVFDGFQVFVRDQSLPNMQPIGKAAYPLD